MDFWSILEIDPTDNVSIVKKAYAKKLKLHHPEDDPEGYQKLREAYDSAVKYIKNNKAEIVDGSGNKEIQEVQEDIFEDNSLENTEHPLPSIDILGDFDRQEHSYEKSVEKFISEAQRLYEDFFSRIEIENWTSLFNSEAMWYMGDKAYLSDRMIRFLMEHNHLPQAIWKLFEDNFNWTDQKNYLFERYPQEFIKYLYKQIENNNGLRYCYFKQTAGVDYEAFLDYREKAFEALYDNDFEYAQKLIDRGFSIYADDPDLLILQGRCYAHRGDTDKAFQIYEDLIYRNSDDVYARFYRAKIVYDRGKKDKAFEECKYIEALGFDSLDFKLFLAKCYLDFKEGVKAKKLLLQLQNIDLFQAEAKDLLKKANMELVYKLKRELKEDRNNSEIKIELDDLYKELGRLDHKQLIRKQSHIIIIRVAICLVILFMQVVSIHSAMKTIGMKDIHSLKSTVQFIEADNKTNVVKNYQDISKLPGEISIVKGRLTNAIFLDLYRIPRKGKQGKIERLYLSSKEAKKRKLFGYMNGYVCTGVLGDRKVIAIVNYKQAMQAYKNKIIDFNGAVHYMPKDDLLGEVKNIYKTSRFDQEFITDRFIDTEVKVSSIRTAALSLSAVMLFIQVVVIFQGLLAMYMLVKVNRR